MKKILKLINSIRNRYVDLSYLLTSFKCFKEIFKSNDIQITGTGVLQLFFDEYIIKIPLGKLSDLNLENEYKNYLKFKNSNLSKYVEYELKKIELFYKIEKLKVIRNLNIDVIIKDLEKEKIQNGEINLSLDLLNKWCNKNFKYSFKYEKSVMHGDLTPKNVMLNKYNQIVLIDLDRFTFFGIKGIDKLHFIIEKECKEQKIDFFDWILKNFEKYKIEKLFLYFVYRINMEDFKDVKLPEIYYQKACKVYNRFIIGG